REVSVKVSVFGLIIRRAPLTSRVPDLAVFERRTIVERDGYIHAAPQLIVEVLSPANTRSEPQEKLADCASLSVPEVWVISPEARTVEILLLENGQLRRSALLAEGILKPTCFPHVQIDIAQIWPDLFALVRHQRKTTLFPYTTLFRSMASLPNPQRVTYEEWLQMP